MKSGSNTCNQTMAQILNSSMNTQQNGFTLIELMVTIAIIGFLSVTGWRQYDQYQTRVVRTDAINALLIEANNMDRCAASQGNIYTDCQLSSDQSENGHYGISFVDPPTTSFIISATRLVPNPDDTNCIAGVVNFDLLINELGQSGIRLGAGGAKIFGNTLQIRKCWNK